MTRTRCKYNKLNVLTILVAILIYIGQSPTHIDSRILAVMCVLMAKFYLNWCEWNNEIYLKSNYSSVKSFLWVKLWSKRNKEELEREA